MHMNRRNGAAVWTLIRSAVVQARKIEYDSRDGIGEEVSRLPGTARATLSVG